MRMHEPPVAELVAEALDDDPPVRGQRARRIALVLEVGEQVLGGELVEVVVCSQPGGGLARGPSRPSRGPASIAAVNAPIWRPSSTGRPTASPCQNGSLPGTPGAGVTVTRLGLMSATRQLLAPSTTTSPCIPARSS